MVTVYDGTVTVNEGMVTVGGRSLKFRNGTVTVAGRDGHGRWTGRSRSGVENERFAVLKTDHKTESKIWTY